MADRKQFVAAGTADQELLALLDAARGKEVSEEDLQEQRISFAYGNAMKSEEITKDSVRTTSKNIRIRA